ncbi:uncharacterized protein LOC111691353 [Anoplophora glabripennis]|uniref:uncharacterized protein LOC111691353 n=1 Tax=Anoplophora glabripennis TaxID=217634 RepID=UPI000C7679FF|nr:uncharacterized protein LOC111691353 [Anoplophora glabripennis]
MKPLGSLSGCKLMRAARTGRPIEPSYYRTRSHAGFPNGSYAVPNPKHFHVPPQTQIAKMRPLLFPTTPHASSSSYSYNKDRTTQPTLTLNLGNCPPVAVNIPVDALRAFIYPFATALNFCSGSRFNNQGCQTTYMSNFERKPPAESDFRKVDYTPLYTDTYQTCHLQPETKRRSQTFERQILEDMQQNLLDFNESFSESESHRTDVTDKSNDTLDKIKEFSEQDEVQSNESLVELTQDISAMFPSSSTSSESLKNQTFERLSCNKRNNDSDNIGDVVKVAENFVDKLMDMSITSANYFLFEKVVNEAKTMLHQEPEGELPNLVNTISQDEGIEDCTLTNDSNNSTLKCSSPVDSCVKKIGSIIFDYLVQQCFEVKELILFPEVLHDLNINKLLMTLKEAYEQCYGNCLNDIEKNELRISLASYVLKLLEIDDRLKDSSQDSSSSIVTDKIFTISEFLSDILDHFFNSLDTKIEPFLDFEKQMTGDNGEVFHSTPESKKRKNDEISNEEKGDGDCPDVTSFKKTEKSGSEIYWITLYTSPVREEQKVHKNKTVVNVDDIPLKPPECHNELNYSKRILSPILEEPRVNLFNSNLHEDECEIFSDSFHQTYEILEKSNDSDNIENDDTSTYVSFATPDSNLIISNEVNFCRIQTLTADPYVQVKEAGFKQKYSDSDNKENEKPYDDVEGNWMGFEGAKF